MNSTITDWTDVVVEVADEFLNAEIPAYDPSSDADAQSFAATEAKRFESDLLAYIRDRQNAGDYVS